MNMGKLNANMTTIPQITQELHGSDQLLAYLHKQRKFRYQNEKLREKVWEQTSRTKKNP